MIKSSLCTLPREERRKKLTFEEKRERVLAIYREEEVLKQERECFMRELQASCAHESVVETDYKPSASGLFSAMPPRRLCIVCGFEEKGWGCGYDKLRADTHVIRKDVSRDEFYALRKLRPLISITLAVPA